MAINKRKLPINPRKIPYYLALSLVTVGASLILGFLSFGGMYALMPMLPLAFAAFILSVAYEGEVYLKNLIGSFKKLFKTDYLKQHLGNDYLQHYFPENTDDKNCPHFFIDYENQLKLLETFKNKPLNTESTSRKNKIKKVLTDMERWFALQLFPDKDDQSEEQSAYTKELRQWLAAHQQKEWQARLQKRRVLFNLVKAFSILSATFMSLGSTYLIVEAFSVIPLMAAIPFAFWPFIIIPLALIAGAAYGMLTYNGITDLINNDTLNKWYTKIRTDLSKGLTPRTVFIFVMAVFLVSIAMALTICTAGTWWTVATSARPLFDWMRKMPSFIMGIINPIITGISTIFFNVQNIAESMEMVDAATQSKTNIFKSTYRLVVEKISHIGASENWLQILNPFRLILKLTITPLRIILFLGHLVSIALTSDRMPGVPQIIALLIAIISEGFEDAHYFIEHNQEQEHKEKNPSRTPDDAMHQPNTLHTHVLVEEHLGDNEEHSTDIPTLLIQTLAFPLYALAAAWDYLMSRINKPSGDKRETQPKALTFTQAWNKQRGIHEAEVEITLPSDAKHPSKEWQAEHATSLIEKYEHKHLKNPCIGTKLATEKKEALKRLKDTVRAATAKGESINEVLSKAKEEPAYSRHRLGAFKSGQKTATQIFVEELPGRINAQECLKMS